ncbi:hypothetical protein MDA_GLEAN10012081 [Myotis davidii]|uniref:DUF4502 domain-containing protein n=1 Tax=Myotis davidii TaxID=225400 RepID=L5MG84_MYODS|nr:hypothetical protein MDA_GLEAN10012081 [Myotis davidii]
MERRVIPRVKPTDSILYTPQKQMKLPRTPEKSANKKQLSRGGLAERLNGLQNRERSAISLWRHQCVSYQKTLSGSRSGVLTVKILELHEECTIQVAMCEQLVGLQAGGSSQGEASGPGLKVLFTKETAHHLRGQPQDIIHIYPPWQKLIIPNGSCPVILNTYFCKKVVAKEDSRTTHEVHLWDTPLPRRNITLSQMFRFKSLTNNSPESQVLCSLPNLRTDWTHRHCPSPAPLSDSLLDTVESQGAATWSGVGVPVVVQRVYFLPCRCQQGGGSAAPPSSDTPSFRAEALEGRPVGSAGSPELLSALPEGKAPVTSLHSQESGEKWLLQYGTWGAAQVSPQQLPMSLPSASHPESPQATPICTVLPPLAPSSTGPPPSIHSPLLHPAPSSTSQ